MQNMETVPIRNSFWVRVRVRVSVRIRLGLGLVISLTLSLTLNLNLTLSITLILMLTLTLTLTLTLHADVFTRCGAKTEESHREFHDDPSLILGGVCHSAIGALSFSRV